MGPRGKHAKKLLADRIAGAREVRCFKERLRCPQKLASAASQPGTENDTV